MSSDKENLLSLIKSGQEQNIDLGVYQWLSQKFDKTELVNKFISDQDLNNDNGWEPYTIEVGGVRMTASISDYSCYEKGTMFIDMSLYYRHKALLSEVIPQSKIDEYAAYYIRKMLDFLEQLIKNETK